MAANFETLSKYLKNGIFLMGINDYNALLTEADENALENESLHLVRDIAKKKIKRSLIRSEKELKNYIDGKVSFKTKTGTIKFPVRRFSFLPAQAELICIDIDVKNGVNGIEEMRKYADKIGLDLKETFNKTTYVKTPNGGYHFYFKAQNDFNAKYKNELCPGVEIKAGKRALTAAGSTKIVEINGRKCQKPYEMIGEIGDSLPIPLGINERFPYTYEGSSL